MAVWSLPIPNFFSSPIQYFVAVFFFRHSCGQNFLSPTLPASKLYYLQKKELRLLTNLRMLKPAYGVSQARLKRGPGRSG